MADPLLIVKKVEAFAPNSPDFSWMDPGKDVSWLVRPFYITDDLRIMHNWLGDVNSFTNQAFDRDTNALIKHYIKRLRSDTEQSFVIQRKKQVVGQFDLVPVACSSFAWLHPVDTDGFALYYLFPGDRLLEYCQSSLEIFIRLVFSSYPDYALFLEIPLVQRDICKKAMGLGFRLVNEYWHQQREVGLFRAKL